MLVSGPCQIETRDHAFRLAEALAGGGSFLFRQLSEHVGSTDDEALATTLWELVDRGITPLALPIPGSDPA